MPFARQAPPAWALLVLLCVASALVLVILGTRLTFFNDDWFFLLQRPGLESHGGADVLLAPHNGNLVVLLAAIMKALVAVFGLHSQLPFRLVLAGTVAAAGVFVYLLVSARVGRPLGLVAAAIVLFLGPASEALLFMTAGLDLVGSLAAGLAAFYVMERDTPRRNVLACVLLSGSILFSNGGLPFVVGAAIAIALRRRPAQLWVAVVPAAVFGLWWILDGSAGPSAITSSNLAHLPKYVFDAASVGLASATGTNHQAFFRFSNGHLQLVVAILGVAVWMLRGNRPPPGVMVFAGAALTFWVLTGANYIPGRAAIASRYQIVDVVFLILIAAEAFRSTRRPRWMTPVLVVLGAAIVVSNLFVLRSGFDFMKEDSGYAKADLGALSLARATAPPSLQLTQGIAHDPYLSGITAGRYFAETRAHGAPALYTPAEISKAPAAQRAAADSVLAAAYTIAPRRVSSSATTAGCTRIPLSAGRSGELELPTGGAVLTDLTSAPLAIGVRRFAPSGRPDYVGFLAGRSTVRLTIPADAATTPWHLVAVDPGRTAAGLAVCPPAP